MTRDQRIAGIELGGTKIVCGIATGATGLGVVKLVIDT